MKYLNNESQFTRVSDAHAKSLMESAGYEVPSEEEVHVDVYAFEDTRFALTEEVVEAEDGLHYIRLQELDETFTVSLDESGEELLVEFVEFDEVDYILEGVYEDGDGNLYACMLSESDFAGDEDEVDEAYGGGDMKKEKMMADKPKPDMKDQKKDKMKAMMAAKMKGKKPGMDKPKPGMEKPGMSNDDDGDEG